MHREEIPVLGKPRVTTPTEKFETAETADSNSNGKEPWKSVAPMANHPSEGVRPIFFPWKWGGYGGMPPMN